MRFTEIWIKPFLVFGVKNEGFSWVSWRELHINVVAAYDWPRWCLGDGSGLFLRRNHQLKGPVYTLVKHAYQNIPSYQVCQILAIKFLGHDRKDFNWSTCETSCLIGNYRKLTT